MRVLISAAFVLGISVIAALTGGPAVGTTSFDDPLALSLAAVTGVALFAVGKVLERLARD